jgi:hypothetical protein
MTLDPRPASPGTDVPSRNRSAPLELSYTFSVPRRNDRHLPAIPVGRRAARGSPAPWSGVRRVRTPRPPAPDAPAHRHPNRTPACRSRPRSGLTAHARPVPGTQPSWPTSTRAAATRPVRRVGRSHAASRARERSLGLLQPHGTKVSIPTTSHPTNRMQVCPQGPSPARRTPGDPCYFDESQTPPNSLAALSQHTRRSQSSPSPRRSSASSWCA